MATPGRLFRVLNVSGSEYSSLTGMSCISGSDCIAVGNSLGPSGVEQTLVESWDGNSWSIVPSPNVSGSTVTELDGVSCFSGSDCTAVGLSLGNGSGGNGGQVLESWDGNSWSIVPSPNLSGAQLFGDRASEAPTARRLGVMALASA